MLMRNDPGGKQGAADAVKSKFVVAFLQARMGSTRLPGKVLMTIQGQSILERAIRRLQAAPIVDAVAVLTTCLSEDDVIVEESHRLGTWVHRGPVQDVLTRFYEASQKFHPDIVIRATADNPLIEIDSIERIIDRLCSDNSDLCMENELPYGTATEAIHGESSTRADAITRVHLRAKENHHREHVTLYMKDHPEEFTLSLIAPPNSLRYPQIRLTVDTPADFAFMNQLIRQLPERGGPLPLSDYLPLAQNILNERECKELAVF